MKSIFTTDDYEALHRVEMHAKKSKRADLVSETLIRSEIASSLYSVYTKSNLTPVRFYREMTCIIKPYISTNIC